MDHELGNSLCFSLANGAKSKRGNRLGSPEVSSWHHVVGQAGTVLDQTVGDDQEKYYEQKYLLNVALTDEDDIVCNPPESWVQLCASEGMCDSHTDAL